MVSLRSNRNPTKKKKKKEEEENEAEDSLIYISKGKYILGQD